MRIIPEEGAGDSNSNGSGSTGAEECEDDDTSYAPNPTVDCEQNPDDDECQGGAGGTDVTQSTGTVKVSNMNFEWKGEQGVAQLYHIPGQEDGTSNHIYRWLAIALGSEPGENGHEGWEGTN